MKLINKLISRAAALVLAAGIAVSGTAFAADKDEGFTFPSGLSFNAFEKMVGLLTNAYGSEINSKLPPTSAAVFHGDEILYTNYEGYINIKEDLVNDENAVFEWGSISKTMIWVSIMQLWEQGEIDLDADIRTYLPDNFLKNLKYDDPITVTDLMNHQGGWCESTYRLFVRDAADIGSLEEELRKIEPAQTFRPGEVSSYSNWGAALAGFIVQRVSGMDFTDYVHRNILEPLGMEHTAVSADHSDNMWVKEQREKLRSYEMPLMLPIWEETGSELFYCPIYPAGSAVGTIGDLARYAQAFVDDGHPLFEKAETQEKLFSGSSFYGNSDIPCCSYGFWSSEYAVQVYGHDGGTNSGVANMLFDRDSKVGLVLLTTNSNYNYNPMLSLLPEYIFGNYTGKDLSSENEKPAGFSGEYVASRSTIKGIGSFFSFLGSVDTDKVEGYTDIGNDVYKYTYTDDYIDKVHILGRSRYSDGTEGIRAGAVEYMPVKLYVPKISLLAAFFLSGISAIFVLLAKRKLRKAKLISPYKGEFILTWAQLAKAASLLAIAVILVAAMSSTGLAKSVGACAGIIQMISFVLCGAAAIAGIAFILKRNTSKYGKICYIFSIAGNIATASAIAVFEMYRFWGC
ncbi:MAG: beta-lactamase family protein [Ruminococcus sp.]|nr:beta-lactamase family protein [Ruminococcus sp.]